MKKNQILLSVFAAIVLFVAGCRKVDPLPYYNDGSKVTVTASRTAIAPAPADSLNTALTLSWTSPNYGTDPKTYKFTVEIDSVGKNFSQPLTKVVTGAESVSFTARELNNYMLDRGYAFNVPVTMQARVISSYANNNESLASNPITLTMTPYKVPPKVPLPTSGRLFIVGEATEFGWSNDPTPPFPAAREFTRVDETTWVGIFNFTGNGGYKLLQQQGNWSTQYHMLSGGTALGGTFELRDADPAFPSPAAGLYKMTVDFQAGTYSLTPFTQQHGLPGELFLVGDATPGGWNNPVPVPSQKFTRLTSTKFELTVPLTAGGKYLILPENGNWGMKFGSNNAAGNTPLAGTFAPEGADMLAPAESGNYRITVDFANNSYVLQKI